MDDAIFWSMAADQFLLAPVNLCCEVGVHDPILRLRLSFIRTVL